MKKVIFRIKIWVILDIALVLDCGDICLLITFIGTGLDKDLKGYYNS